MDRRSLYWYDHILHSPYSKSWKMSEKKTNFKNKNRNSDEKVVIEPRALHCFDSNMCTKYEEIK